MPKLVTKRQNDVSEIELKVMSMYAKVMSNRIISVILKDIYGFEKSHETISRIIDRVKRHFTMWQSKPHKPVYAFVYVDVMVTKAKNNGRVVNKAAYTLIGIDTEW